MGSGKRKRLAERPNDFLSLAGQLSAIRDPRDSRGKKHDLQAILAMVIIGMLWGYCDFVNMRERLSRKRKWLEGFLDVRNGIPSHDTFSRVMAMIPAYELEDCFLLWVAQLMSKQSGGHVVIDGKAVRAASPKGLLEYYSTYVQNAFHAELGICIGQIRVGEKTNEKTAIPRILDLIRVDGCVVTIDAIGCQSSILDKIIARNAQFVMPVKDNCKALCRDLQFTLENAVSDGDASVSHSQTFEKDHGRYEKREYRSMPCADGMLSDDTWRNVHSIGKVCRAADDARTARSSRQTVYYISSMDMDSEAFARYVRGHWSIENTLHYVLDGWRFREDRCSARTSYAIENLALMRKIVFNLMAVFRRGKGKPQKDLNGFFCDNPSIVRDLIIKPIHALEA